MSDNESVAESVEPADDGSEPQEAIRRYDCSDAERRAAGLADADFIEVTSGWSRLTDKIVRVNSPTSGDTDRYGLRHRR